MNYSYLHIISSLPTESTFEFIIQKDFVHLVHSNHSTNWKKYFAHLLKVIRVLSLYDHLDAHMIQTARTLNTQEGEK